MNAQLLEQARSAYRVGDFAGAAQMFAAAKNDGELCGEADHLRGNSLMRLGRFAEAATAYEDALADSSYAKRGALLTNQGKARLSAGDIQGAAESFHAATQDATYATPYKAYQGLGDALLRLGDATNAGVAFRQAAIDVANPAPAAALSNLGLCFLKIGRPDDAVESYRTALDFAVATDDTRAISAGLGQAFSAAGKYSDAIDAFQRACADGIYQLTPEQTSAYQTATDTLSAQRSMAATPTAGYSSGIDPLDPLGKSGQFMPDPSDTGFFTLTESEMIQQDREQQKVRRKHRHTGLKVFLAILLILVLAGGGLAFAYTRGLGYPSQQDTLTNLFNAVTNGTDTSEFLSSSLSDEAKNLITSTIPEGATPTIEGMDQSMTESTATVSVSLSMGGTQDYEVGFVREGIGWKVSSLTIDFSATEDNSASATEDTSTDETADTSDSTETTDDTTSTESSDTSTDSADAATDSSIDTASTDDTATQ